MTDGSKRGEDENASCKKKSRKYSQERSLFQHDLWQFIQYLKLKKKKKTQSNKPNETS